jgi:hypothetical protein
LYNPSSISIDRLNKLQSLPDECVNVYYPEGWYFKVSSDSIYLTNKREPFQLK